MCVRASWVVMCVYFYIACRRARRTDGKELFFEASGGTLMAVEAGTNPAFHSGIPKPLFRLPARRTVEGT
jgi:hypothetical protein